MPVHKGKRNKNRPRGKPRPVTNDDTPTARRSSDSGATPVRQRRPLWQGPPWFNAALGIFMLVAGTVFFVLPQKGVGTRDRALFLAGYVLLGGFYLFRAYRGYRREPR
jgi:hypothetical protein